MTDDEKPSAAGEHHDPKLSREEFAIRAFDVIKILVLGFLAFTGASHAWHFIGTHAAVSGGVHTPGIPDIPDLPDPPTTDDPGLRHALVCLAFIYLLLRVMEKLVEELVKYAKRVSRCWRKPKRGSFWKKLLQILVCALETVILVYLTFAVILIILALWMAMYICTTLPV